MALLKVSFICVTYVSSKFLLSLLLKAFLQMSSLVIRSYLGMRLPLIKEKKELSRNYMCEQRLFDSGLHVTEFCYGV